MELLQPRMPSPSLGAWIFDAMARVGTNNADLAAFEGLALTLKRLPPTASPYEIFDTVVNGSEDWLSLSKELTQEQWQSEFRTLAEEAAKSPIPPHHEAALALATTLEIWRAEEFAFDASENLQRSQRDFTATCFFAASDPYEARRRFSIHMTSMTAVRSARLPSTGQIKSSQLQRLSPSPSG